GADDGTEVPVSVVYRADLVRMDGSAPLLLDAYGAYEICNDPHFSSARLPLLDRGVVYAIAHVRGGGEMGRRWYENGKFLRKKNTFSDLVACARHLRARGYAGRRICLEGRSAGGLTVGATLNLQPDLFCAAILGVPFVDCLTTMLDESIPLTAIEWEEWGNPAQKEYYDYMRSYSPVDNLRPGAAYPHIFVSGGLHDPRVGYWEPAKYVAKLRELNAGENMLVFKCDMGAGHFSQSGRFDRLKERALEMAFLLKACDMTEVQAC
ncbi:prolyl oligopeptidase, partial [Helicosporidium sp. ATCC 50920]